MTVALEIDDAECLGCGACESACPHGAVTQGAGFPVAYEIDPLLCNDGGRCLTVCPVEGLVSDPDWAVCHGRGCPLSSRRLSGVECSEGRDRCPDCGSVLWRLDGGPWECRACAPGSAGGHGVGCPKVRRARRLAGGERCPPEGASATAGC